MKRVSRSAIVTRKQCEMKRYQQYELRGHGIQPKDFSDTDGVVGMGALPKVRGALFHDTALAIVEGASTKEWQDQLTAKSTVLPASIRDVQSTLIRRALLGWQIVRGDFWRAHYDVISAEKEWLWQLSPRIVQPLRLDKILRRKDDGHLGIFDYKTMGSVDPNWIQRMEFSDQTHLYVQALKERSGEFVLGICYDGVVIGKMYKGVQKSPFVTGYEKNGKVSATWTSGSTAVSLTSYSDDKWLDWMNKQGKLEELYVTTDFLNPPPQMLLHTKHATARAEEDWLDRIDSLEAIRESMGEDSPHYRYQLNEIEKNPDQCLKYGLDYACPFVAQCWRGHGIDDDFEPRKDHHAEGDDE